MEAPRGSGQVERASNAAAFSPGRERVRQLNPDVLLRRERHGSCSGESAGELGEMRAWSLIPAAGRGLNR